MSKKLSREADKLLKAHYGKMLADSITQTLREQSVMARLVFSGYDQPRIIPKDLKPLPGQDEYGRRNGT